MIKELSKKLQQSQKSLQVIKFVFVVWSLSALGVFEQHKAEMAREYNDHFLVYSTFWLILSGLAYLLNLFYKAESLEDISKTLGMTLTYVMLPIVYMLVLLLQVTLVAAAPWNTGLITIMTAIPMIVIGIKFWFSMRKSIPS